MGKSWCWIRLPNDTIRAAFRVGTFRDRHLRDFRNVFWTFHMCVVVIVVALCFMLFSFILFYMQFYVKLTWNLMVLTPKSSNFSRILSFSKSPTPWLRCSSFKLGEFSPKLTEKPTVAAGTLVIDCLIQIFWSLTRPVIWKKIGGIQKVWKTLGGLDIEWWFFDAGVIFTRWYGLGFGSLKRIVVDFLVLFHLRFEMDSTSANRINQW